MAQRKVHLPHILLARRRSDRDPRGHGLRIPVSQLRLLDDADLLHQGMQSRILEPLRSERPDGHRPVQQGDGDAIREAVVGGLPRPWTPLRLIPSDNLDRHAIAADLHLGHSCERPGSFRIQHLLPDEERRLDRGLRMVFHRVVFNVCLEDLERILVSPSPALAGECRQIERPRHQLHEALLALKDRGWPAHALLGEDGGEHAVPCGIRKGAGLPHGEGSHSRLPQRHVGHAGEIDRLDRLGLRQLQHLGRGQRGRKGTVRHMVPPARPERRSVAQPALDLVGEGDGLNGLLAGSMGRLCNGQDRRDIVRRMRGLLRQVGVVKVQVADQRPVGEGGQIRKGLMPCPPQRRAVHALHCLCRAAGDPARLGGPAAEGTPEAVQDPAFDLMYHGGGKMRIGKRPTVLGEAIGNHETATSIPESLAH